MSSEQMSQPVPSEQVPATGSPPAQPDRRRRVVVLVVVAVLVIGAVAVGIVWWAQRDDGPRAASGEFIEDVLDDAALHQTYALLPWGELAISATEPLDRIPNSTLLSTAHHATYDKIAPPEGGSWVGIKLDPDLLNETHLYRATPDAKAPPTRITVLVDGRSVPLARSASGSGTGSDVGLAFAQGVEGYVALPGRPDDGLRVRIEFGGVAQEVTVGSGVRKTGRAALLYTARHRTLQRTCDKGAVPGYRITRFIDAECSLTRADTVPYVAGLGWARPGNAWLVTTVRTYPPSELVRRSPSGTKAYYYPPHGTTLRTWTTTVRYGDGEPVATARYNTVETQFGVDPDDPDQFVFSVPDGDTGAAHPFSVITRFAAGDPQPRVPGAPVSPTLVVTRHVTVG